MIGPRRTVTEAAAAAVTRRVFGWDDAGRLRARREFDDVVTMVTERAPLNVHALQFRHGGAAYSAAWEPDRQLWRVDAAETADPGIPCFCETYWEAGACEHMGPAEMTEAGR